jgi:hypothetical protein
MKTKISILNALAIAATISLTSTAAMAHSDHDHSTVSYKWKLSQDMASKMERNLVSSNPTSLIGLSHFEQKKLDHYDIDLGNRFNTEVRGINFLMERTSAGMKIIDANRASNVAYTDQVPIKETNQISNASMNHKSHVGHDHGHLPYEWIFNVKTQAKIAQAMVQNKKDIYVGLNQFEQSLLKEYDIKPGNTFQTTIAGHRFLVEKATAGVRVINHVGAQGVAMAPHNDMNM